MLQARVGGNSCLPSTHLSLQLLCVCRLSSGPGHLDMLPQLSHLLLQLHNLQVHLVHFTGELMLDSDRLQGLLPQLGNQFRRQC